MRTIEKNAENLERSQAEKPAEVILNVFGLSASQQAAYRVAMPSASLCCRLAAQLKSVKE